MNRQLFDKPITCSKQLGTRKKLDRLKELLEREGNGRSIPLYEVADTAISEALARALKRHKVTK